MKRSLILSALLLSGTYSFAQVVDSSFGVNGYTEVTMNLGYITQNKGSATAMAIQPDGKIVVGVDLMDPGNSHWYYQTRRYNTNGTLDTSFGVNGVKDVFYGSDCVNEDLFIEADGKIVSIGNGEYCINGVCGLRNLAMLRYKPNGDVDSSFGTNGLLLTQDIFGGGHYCIPRRVKPAAGDKYIIAGQGVDGSAFIARLNHNGTLDMSFATNGVYMDTAVASNLRDIAVDNNGNIYALIRRFNGSVFVPNPQDQAVLKLDANGDLVATFGNHGIALFDFDEFEAPEGIALTSQGKIAITGSVCPVDNWDDSATVGYIALLEPNGSLTTSIPGGYRRFQCPGDSTLYFKSIQTLPNNGFLLNGISDTRSPDGHLGWKAILFRTKADLTPDMTFDLDGWMRFHYGVTNPNGSYSNYSATFYTAKMLPNGDIIGGGHRNVVLNGKMGTFLLKLKNVPAVPPALNVPGMGNGNMADIKVYPNPVNDVLHIESNTPVRYMVINIAGQIMHAELLMERKHDLHLSQYPSGLYMLQLTDEKGNNTSRSFVRQ